MRAPRLSARRLCLALLLAVAGCSTGPVALSGTLPPAADGFACATRQLDTLGYTVEAGGRNTGFVRGSRQTSTLGFRYNHLLTVAVFERPDEAPTMRVIATRREFVSSGNPEGRPMAPTDDTLAHAREILEQCGASDLVGIGPE